MTDSLSANERGTAQLSGRETQIPWLYDYAIVAHAIASPPHIKTPTAPTPPDAYSIPSSHIIQSTPLYTHKPGIRE